MKGIWKFTSAVILFVSLVAAATGGSAAARPAVIAANTTTYQDSTGENPVAPDIASVVVSNDDTGSISFAIHFANRSVLTTEILGVEMDTDMNATTGDPPFGFDYGVQYRAGRSAVIGRWDAAQLDWVLGPMTTLRTDWANSTLTIHVNASELGSTSAMAFGAYAYAVADDSSSPADMAPDRPPLWTYEVKLAPVLAVASLDVTPEPAVAGKTMAAKAALSVTRGGKTEPLSSAATVAWKASAGGLELKATDTDLGPDGVATATWTLAPTLTDKAIELTVSVSQEGVTATKTVTLQLLHPAPALRVASIDCTPEPAIPGRAMTGHARLVVTRGGTPVALPGTARVKWSATVGTLRLTPLITKAMPDGVLTSSWKLPQAIKAKVVRVVLTVTLEKVAVTKTHLHRIR